MIRRISLPLMGLLLSLACGAAQAATIVVNTTSDENGENPNACSLREAIKASTLKQAYGGCTAGQLYYTDTIQLAANATYTLTQGELVIASDMNINGDPATDPYSLDPISGLSPKRLPVTTTIVAANGQRIFNSLVSASPINLNNLNLKGGTADLGGAILAGGTVGLYRVNISGANATSQGGAIYLSGVQATVTATSSSFTGNNAPQGAVFSMSCMDNLGYAVRTVTLNQVSITGNGSSSSANTMDFCGQPTIAISASTISQNTASNTSVDASLQPAVLRMIGGQNTRLSPASTMNLVSNTITENHTPVTLAYNYPGGLSLTNNFLAYNDALDCQYVGLPDPTTTSSATYNLLTGSSTTGTTNSCQLYRAAATTTSNTETNLYPSGTQSRTSFLYPLGLYGGSDLSGYLPIPVNNPLIMHAGALVANCGSTDQRGLKRGSGTRLNQSLSSQNIKCDVGALEYSILTVNDDQNGANTSYNVVISQTVNTTGLTQAQIDKANAQIKSYLDAYKASYRYREVVMDVVANDSGQETLNGNTSTLGLLNDPDIYTITPFSTDPNILCTWEPTMKQLIASRIDGTTTPGGSKDECQYTATNKLTGATPAEPATVSFTVSNIAPIAKDDKYTLTFGTKSIPLDILANDSDDGDGPFEKSPNAKAGKPWWYLLKTVIDPSKPATDGSNGSINNIKYTPLNIRIVTQPTQGTIVPEFQGPCPDNNVNTAQTTCYGGTMTYVNNNLFSPFNDSFTYQVLDSDLTASNTALVTITNTATTTDVTKSGGGSIGFGAIFGMLSLVLMRRRLLAHGD
ncbi:CSLREA domain-containing protein [Aquirhabdus sp.]|uniref:CSLREA domain-containing protein n=1 Tax=Aquirhabdus sp. TaxID=2824160 RepID=UPI00396CF1C2